MSARQVPVLPCTPVPSRPNAARLPRSHTAASAHIRLQRTFALDLLDLALMPGSFVK